MRKLGIPTVIDRTLQQAITQQLVPIYEPLFAEGSFGYRPNKSAKDAILKIKEYAERGYTFAVVLDLSKYFDMLNHEILINLLRREKGITFQLKPRVRRKIHIQCKQWNIL